MKLLLFCYRGLNTSFKGEFFCMMKPLVKKMCPTGTHETILQISSSLYPISRAEVTYVSKVSM